MTAVVPGGLLCNAAAVIELGVSGKRFHWAASNQMQRANSSYRPTLGAGRANCCWAIKFIYRYNSSYYYLCSLLKYTM